MSIRLVYPMEVSAYGGTAWANNCERVNEVVEAFNEYQKKKDRSEHDLEVLKAMLTRCKEYGKENFRFDNLHDNAIEEMEMILEEQRNGE